MVEDDDLGGEIGRGSRRVVLGVTSDVATTQLLDGHVLDVEADVIAGPRLYQGLVVHLDGLNFSRQLHGGERNDGTGLDDTWKSEVESASDFSSAFHPSFEG